MTLDPVEEARMRLVENTLLLMPSTLERHRLELISEQQAVRGELKDIREELSNINGSVKDVVVWRGEHIREHSTDEVARKVRAAVLEGAQEARDGFWRSIGLVPKIVAGVVIVTGPLGWIGAILYAAYK